MTAKILIVDDDIDTLQLVGTMLERQGYTILAANNGKKAIDIAVERLYHICAEGNGRHKRAIHNV